MISDIDIIIAAICFVYEIPLILLDNAVDVIWDSLTMGSPALLANFFGGGSVPTNRSPVTDQRGVVSGKISSDESKGQLVVVDSDAEVVDLIGEGSIEGLVSGTWSFEGAKGATGYTTTTPWMGSNGFTHYIATGTLVDSDSEEAKQQRKDLGFLQSIYWNNTPVADRNGFYNFSNINVEYTKGLPEGNLAALNPDLPFQESMDLTVERPIGERLYGLSLQGGSIPSATKDSTPSQSELAESAAIDTVAKTYSIINKECGKVQLRVRVSQLFEQIRDDDAPRSYDEDDDIPAVGYGDIKARSIRYNIYYRPLFDTYSDTTDGTPPEIPKWEFYKTETIQGHVDQVYVRSTTIDFPSEYFDQPGFNGWEIKIIRTTPESLTAYLKNQSFVDSIVEIYGTKLRYPYSSMVYSKFDAEFFSRIPSRSYDTKLLKVKIPNNYNPIKKTYGRSDALTILDAGWGLGGGTINCKVTTKLKEDQLVYFQNGAIMKVGTETLPTASTSIPAGSTWVRGGSHGALYGNYQYPTLGDQAATTEGYSGGTDSDNFWDGGFKQIDQWPAGMAVPFPTPALVEKEWTDNPAWCFYDLLTNPRYGLGDFLEESQVDKWALYEISQYCDVIVPDGNGGLEPRFTMNHIITSREEAYKVVNDLSSIFRGIVYYSNGLIHAVQDAFKQPLYQFNNSNVVEGSFNYSSSSKKSRHSVAVVRYIDKTNLYQPAVEYVEDPESIKRYGLRQIETTALGCTSRGQARRFGQWLLASESQETESVSFDVGQDGAYLKPGDIVQIYDQYRTPLKFGGRTNIVQGVESSPAGPITYPEPVIVDGEYTLGPDQGPVTGNSIIIDNAVAFTPDTIYKFSLLTPTYNYESTEISDLASTDEVRRSQIQNLYFDGSHTQTITGSYGDNLLRSDYEEGGSGIATQIYFHTGLMLTDGTPIGTGNQLDFDNYVITGYTNDYVKGDVDGTTDVPASYSGGCFSGENLVWSAEVNNPTGSEYISGHFANYRIINVAESDQDNSYGVSALAYSTGKYDYVENRLAFEDVQVDKRPIWPYLHYNRTIPQSGIQDWATIEAGHPNDNTAGFPEARYDDYSTFEVTFPQASTALEAGMAAGVNTRYDIQSASKFSLPQRMNYHIYVMEQDTLGNGFNDASLTKNSFTIPINDGGATENVGAILHEVTDEEYNKNFLMTDSDNLPPERPVLYYLDGDPTKSASQKGFAIGATTVEDGKTPKAVQFFLEKLITKDTNYWFAIFAFNNRTRSREAIVGLIPSTTAVVSNGLISSKRIKSNQTFSLVKGLNIDGLSTQSLIGPSTTRNALNVLNSTQPSFNWDLSNIYDEDNVGLIDFYDDYGKRMALSSTQLYRITIRKYNKRFETNSAVNDWTPSSDIYLEITGYEQPIFNASFVFLRDYNSPHIVSSLHENSDATKYDAQGKADASLSQEDTAWYKVDESGVIFKNNPNAFPLRQFDVVVEAHDRDGATSAGNFVWNGTINPVLTVGEETTNTYQEMNGYNFLPCSLGTPSGLVFAQYDEDPKDRLDDYSFLTQGQAHTREYPYLAHAAVYTNGELHLNLDLSQDLAGNTILDPAQLKNSFPDVRGLVYYYSTGDNSSIDSEVEGLNGKSQIVFNPNNKAPFFDLQPENIASSFNFGRQGNVKYIKSNGDYGDYGKKNSPAATEGQLAENIAEEGQPPVYRDTGKNVLVYRYFHLFDSSTDPRNIIIKFPKIAASNVQNLYLTVALFDSLSFLEHFDERGFPKTKALDLNGAASETSKTPVPGVIIKPNGDPEVVAQTVETILLDDTLNFSTIPYDSHDAAGQPVDWKDELRNETVNPPVGFMLPPGSPIFLKERSLQTKGQSALAYRAWWDITLDPGEQYFEMDFDQPLVTTEGDTTPFYRGPYKLNRAELPESEAAIEKISGPFVKYAESVTAALNKNKFKGISSIDFEVTPSSLLEYGTPGDRRHFPFEGYLTINFETEQDPSKYTVDLEFKGMTAASSQQQVVKITDGPNETNQNSNLRDYVPNDYPLGDCRLEEKSKKYIKLFLSPFYIGSVSQGGMSAEEKVQSGEWWWWRKWWVASPGRVDYGTYRNQWKSGGYPANGARTKVQLRAGVTLKAQPYGARYLQFDSRVTAGVTTNVRYFSTFGFQDYLKNATTNEIIKGWVPNNKTWYPNFNGGGDDLNNNGRFYMMTNLNSEGSLDYIQEGKWSIDTWVTGMEGSVEAEALSKQQQKVNTFIANAYGKSGLANWNFLGQQIKIKGGILQTDTFDVVPL